MIHAVCGAFGITSVLQLKQHEEVCPAGRRGWSQVGHLRAIGKLEDAQELARDLLGVQGPKMTEEQKQKLREYSKTPEAKARAKANRVRKQVAVNATKRARERREEQYARKAAAQQQQQQVALTPADHSSPRQTQVKRKALGTPAKAKHKRTGR